MKRETLHNKKFKRLVRATGRTPVECCGILNFLWDWVGRNNPDGAIDGDDMIDIADDMGYSDDEGQTVFAALLSTGWIDEIEAGLFIHDWPEHCEDRIHATLARAGKTFGDGTLPKSTKLGKSEREKAAAKSGEIRQPKTAARRNPAESGEIQQPTIPLPLPNRTVPLPEAEDGRTAAQAQKRTDGVSFEDLRAATGDPPEFKPYWVEVGRLLRECGEYPVLPKALAHMRASPGIKKPGAWLNRQCSEALAKHGMSMPKPPSRAAPEEKSA